MSPLTINGTSSQLMTVITISIIGFCVIAPLGIWDFTRREHH
jgi:hypothetical protein